ncbi:MAG: M23 family metallopeptidase [bacterium]|nr:M23 family metallopeptidase [bacterium]
MSRRMIVTILAIALAMTAGINAASAFTTPRSTPFSLNPNPDSWSHIDWPFASTTTGWNLWYSTSGSSCHTHDDYYAEDWLWGGGGPENGLGKTVYAPGPGTVMYAADRGDGYGNQVIIELADQTSMAVRYAHLETIAVNDGDYVHFGSEIGTLGDSGGQSAVHLHLVVYRAIDTVVGGYSGRQRLEDGLPPGGGPLCNNPGGPSVFAAWFDAAGIPYSTHPGGEDLPCNMWNGNVTGCDAHSIPWGGKYTQDCAYYWGSGLCLPRGTSNCRAYIHGDCWDNSFWNDADESLPCHHWNGDQFACDLHRGGQTRDCAYYWGTQTCRPRGTANCLVGIEYYCYH